jgi:hypothetical protein
MYEISQSNKQHTVLHSMCGPGMFDPLERTIRILTIGPWVLLASAPLIIVGIGLVTGPVKDAVVGLFKKK